MPRVLQRNAGKFQGLLVKNTVLPSKRPIQGSPGNSFWDPKLGILGWFSLADEIGQSGYVGHGGGISKSMICQTYGLHAAWGVATIPEGVLDQSGPNDQDDHLSKMTLFRTSFLYSSDQMDHNGPRSVLVPFWSANRTLATPDGPLCKIRRKPGFVPGTNPGMSHDAFFLPEGWVLFPKVFLEGPQRCPGKHA